MCTVDFPEKPFIYIAGEKFYIKVFGDKGSGFVGVLHFDALQQPTCERKFDNTIVIVYITSVCLKSTERNLSLYV